MPLRPRQTSSPEANGFSYFYKLPMLLVMTARKRQSYIIGIDEVGRGPLAGPVVVCAVAIPRTLKPSSLLSKKPLRPSTLRQAQDEASSGSRTIPPTHGIVLRDSKKLSASQRNAWASAIKADPRIRHAIASASPRTIDRINVTQAANRAATRALTKLLIALPASARVAVFLDGGLYLHETRKTKYEKRTKVISTYTHTTADSLIRFKATTVIKGDEIIPAISMASIIAKECRDMFMYRAHKIYPQYGFDCHVGYGTKKHIAAIKANGHTPLHRNSFLKKIS